MDHGPAAQLDAIDIRILDALQQKGDLTMAELAEQVFRSHTQCSRRVRRLEELGIIQGYAATLSPAALGLKLKAYINVTLLRHSTQAVEFHNMIRDCPEVVECSMVTGDGDFLLKVYTRDMEHFRELLSKLSSVDIVGTLKSVIAISDLKNVSSLPLPPLPA